MFNFRTWSFVLVKILHCFNFLWDVVVLQNLIITMDYHDFSF